MRRIESSRKITYWMMEVQEVPEEIPALPNAARSPHELSRAQEPGGLINSSRAISRSSRGAPSSSIAGQYAAESQRLRNELNGMQQMQAEWKGRIGVEVNGSLRQPGEAARNATRVLQHEGREMYEHQEERIRRTTAEAESLMSEEGMRRSSDSCLAA